MFIIQSCSIEGLETEEKSHLVSSLHLPPPKNPTWAKSLPWCGQNRQRRQPPRFGRESGRQSDFRQIQRPNCESRRRGTAGDARRRHLRHRGISFRQPAHLFRNLIRSL